MQSAPCRRLAKPEAEDAPVAQLDLAIPRQTRGDSDFRHLDGQHGSRNRLRFVSAQHALGSTPGLPRSYLLSQQRFQVQESRSSSSGGGYSVRIRRMPVSSQWGHGIDITQRTSSGAALRSTACDFRTSVFQRSRMALRFGDVGGCASGSGANGSGCSAKIRRITSRSLRSISAMKSATSSSLA